MHNAAKLFASTITAGIVAVTLVESRAENPAHAPGRQLSNTRHDLPDDSLRSRLLVIARNYQAYGRVDDETRWAPFLCRMPMPSMARFSQSNDADTHGQKLYFLFAKDRPAYLSAGTKPSPLGQVIVKEAWKAEEVKGDSKPGSMRDIKRLAVAATPKRGTDKIPLLGAGSYYPYAEKDGKAYRAAVKSGLYIMLKVDSGTEGTDQGWVYGTVTTDSGVLDGKQPLKVTAAGRIESCMSCHQEAKVDRLFGLAGR